MEMNHRYIKRETLAFQMTMAAVVQWFDGKWVLLGSLEIVEPPTDSSKICEGQHLITIKGQMRSGDTFYSRCTIMEVSEVWEPFYVELLFQTGSSSVQQFALPCYMKDGALFFGSAPEQPISQEELR